MKIHYIYAHPSTCSFNHALLEAAKLILSQDDSITDLYASKFKAVADWDDFTTKAAREETSYNHAQQVALQEDSLPADVVRELHAIDASDYVVLQFPLWWFSAPAIIKGWFDRVFVKGKTYAPGKLFNDGSCVGKKVMLVTTTQSPASSFTAGGLHGPITHSLFSLHHSLRFVGFTILEPFVAYGVLNQTNEEREHTILHYQAVLKNLSNREKLNER